MTQTEEQLFLEVATAFKEMGISMDQWTSNKYEGLMNAFQQNGKLTESQRKLLVSLPDKVKQYKQNAPVSKPVITKAKVNPTSTRPVTSLSNPLSRFPLYDPHMAEWVLDFEAKMRTAWVPTKDEIFQYGYFMRRLGSVYHPPSRWAEEFKEYYDNGGRS